MRDFFSKRDEVFCREQNLVDDRIKVRGGICCFFLVTAWTVVVYFFNILTFLRFDSSLSTKNYGFSSSILPLQFFSSAVKKTSAVLSDKAYTVKEKWIWNRNSMAWAKVVLFVRCKRERKKESWRNQKNYLKGRPYKNLEIHT